MDTNKSIPFSKKLDLESDRGLKVYKEELSKIIGAGFGVDVSRGDISIYLKNLPNSEKEDVVLGLIDARDKKILSEDEFAWLKKEKRACNFAWMVLKEFSEVEMRRLLEIPSTYHLLNKGWSGSIFDNAIESKNFSDENFNLAEIKLFFDNIDIDILQKKKLMKFLEDGYAGVMSEGVKLKWLDKGNEEQCEWAWGHVRKSFPDVSFSSPISYQDKYAYIVAFIDKWKVHKDTKILFSVKFKKAWDQKIYRKKQKDKSPLNTYISINSKEQLDFLAEKREEKIYQTLERIIRKAHEEFVSNSAR